MMMNASDNCPSAPAGAFETGRHVPMANHSSCGVGILADLDGKSGHGLVLDGLECL
ncbi:MAG: hypothetical protein U5S82_00255 [Gammaproteobacteria bacterium]|nr:hypothetical protein [Gammaproteobacteria bacterium]